MMRTDIFGLAPRQQDMFGAPQETFDTMMSDDEIRVELNQTLAQMRTAEAMPWDHRQLIQISNMFPEIAARLPESERLIAEFNSQMRRLRKEAA